jgi:anti-anti-sigma factor
MLQDERHLSFKARLDNVPAATEFIVQGAEAAGLDARGVYHCQLAVDEACTNIIEHGRIDERTGQVTLKTGIEHGRTFVITIMDNGAAFNPLTYQDPDPLRPLEEREGGGWGIYFIKKLMDVIDYRYAEGKNQLSLYKSIDGTTEETPQTDEQPININRRNLEQGYILLSVTGQIDSHTSAQLEDALNAELHAEHYRLIVAFDNVTYISSSGLKVLVTAWRKAHDEDGDVLITGLQPRISEVFEMIGFDMMFNIYETVAKAIAENPIDA